MQAWGPAGHIIIGFSAQPLLCDAATAEIARLGEGESLARIGLWADQIRSEPQWRHSAPWHYVNISDDGDPRRPPVSAQGNVMTATQRFAATLASDDAAFEARAVALRFLVHFIADIHQPLHVGRAADRGGNRIDVSFDDVQANLHAFWDTHAIRLRGRSIREYVEAISQAVRDSAAQERGSNVRDWAAQAFALREQVYDFDLRTGRLNATYLDAAAKLAEQQLTLAAAHLANTLNAAFCR